MKIGTATMDNSMEAPSKTNNRSGFVFVSFIPDLELKKSQQPRNANGHRQKSTIKDCSPNRRMEKGHPSKMKSFKRYSPYRCQISEEKTVARPTRGAKSSEEPKLSTHPNYNETPQSPADGTRAPGTRRGAGLA